MTWFLLLIPVALLVIVAWLLIPVIILVGGFLQDYPVDK